MHMEIMPLDIAAYEEARDLWQNAPGVGLSNADSRENIQRFLRRNPGLSFIARVGGRVIGTALCGHDGRRGYIHHLAVSETHRRQGIGRALVEKCIDGLGDAGIDKCHIFVFSENRDAIRFWENADWVRRIELTMMSRYTAQGS